MIWAHDISMPKTASFGSDERIYFAVRLFLDIDLSQHCPAAPPEWF
jgi:hypothetical protein